MLPTPPSPILWDPSGTLPDQEEIELDTKKRLIRLASLRSGRPVRQQMTIWLVVGCAVTLILFITRQPNLFTIFCAFAPAMLYGWQINTLQAEMVASAVAQELGWYYLGQKSSERWRLLSQKHPEALQKGDRGQAISDQYWGTLSTKNGANLAFWYGLFSFTRGHGRQSTHHQQTVIALRLSDPVATSLRLVPETAGTALANIVTKTDLSLESQEFNKAFHITYTDRSLTKPQEIYEVLEPSVMAALLDLRTHYGAFELSLCGSTAIITLHTSNLLSPKYTNLYQSFTVDGRDITAATALFTDFFTAVGKLTDSLG